MGRYRTGSDSLSRQACLITRPALVTDSWAFGRSTGPADDRAKSLRDYSQFSPRGALKPNDVSIRSKTALPKRSTFSRIPVCQNFPVSIAVGAKRCRFHLLPSVGLLDKFLRRTPL